MDTPQFQRLRRIKQLGLISLIYPGATHTRFEHSVGTINLGSKLAKKLELENDEQDLIRISALLHDIGHGPFSHVSEKVLSVKHEELTKYVIKHTSLRDLVDEKFDVNEITDIITGKGYLGPIVSGELDVDRMDYLLRDSHNTGVAYGIIDYERIISNLKLEDGLVLDIKGVQAEEGALVSRYFMYPSVYQQWLPWPAGCPPGSEYRCCLPLSFQCDSQQPYEPSHLWNRRRPSPRQPNFHQGS